MLLAANLIREVVLRRSKGRAAIASRIYALIDGRVSLKSLVQTLAVAEYLSFQRAALALGTSQSSVSARIKLLEEDLGVILFQRNTRGVRLTEAGREFVDQVQEGVRILDAAIKTAGMNARGEKGELRIGVYALTAGWFLDRLLNQFHEKYPSIRLQIIEATARDAEIMLRECRIDIAFMAQNHEISDLNSRIIWRDRLVVALPVMHPLAQQTHIEWRHLAGETFLVRHGGSGPQIHDLIVTRATGNWLTPTIHRCDVGRSTLLSMIAAGHGLSVFVEEVVQANTANVCFLPISDEPETIAFSAVWSPQNRDPALLKLLSVTKKVDCPHLSPDTR